MQSRNKQKYRRNIYIELIFSKRLFLPSLIYFIALVGVQCRT